MAKLQVAENRRAEFRALEPSCEFEGPPNLFVLWRTGVIFGRRSSLEVIREELADLFAVSPEDYGEITDDQGYPVATPSDLAVSLTQEFREALLDVRHSAEPSVMMSAMADARRLIEEMGAVAASMTVVRPKE